MTPTSIFYQPKLRFTEHNQPTKREMQSDISKLTPIREKDSAEERSNCGKILLPRLSSVKFFIASQIPVLIPVCPEVNILKRSKMATAINENTIKLSKISFNISLRTSSLDIDYSRSLSNLLTIQHSDL